MAWNSSKRKAPEIIDLTHSSPIAKRVREDGYSGSESDIQVVNLLPGNGFKTEAPIKSAAPDNVIDLQDEMGDYQEEFDDGTFLDELYSNYELYGE